MIRPAWWDCVKYGHMWKWGMPEDTRCAFCGTYLIPWRKRIALRIWCWWRGLR